MRFSGPNAGKLLAKYSAATVNAVLSPSPYAESHTVESSDFCVEVRQNGDYLPQSLAGADVNFDQQGRSLVRVVHPRMYEIVRNPEFVRAQLELTISKPGLRCYTFSFTGCVVASDKVKDVKTFTMR
jgi:hypothetical protein